MGSGGATLVVEAMMASGLRWNSGLVGSLRSPPAELEIKLGAYAVMLAALVKLWFGVLRSEERRVGKECRN